METMEITSAMDASQKYEVLLESLRKYGKLCVAYSGGSDSTLLLKAAVDALSKQNVVGIIAVTDFFAKKEIEDAKRTAEELGVVYSVVSIDVLQLPQLANNEYNRCYHCKKTIFSDIAKAAYSFGIKTIADGKIKDDSSVYRPGAAAAAELGIVSPLEDCGLHKRDVREISAFLGLPTWNKPTNSCLSTRFPYDTEITKEKLETIERAEEFISGFVSGALRFRTHGDIARIEVGKEDFGGIMNNHEEISKFVTGLGFRFATLDLTGFRSGSMDAEWTVTDK